jgi:type I restriction enzyme R subunit
MIKDHIATSFHLDKDDLDYSPLDAKGGVIKMWGLFGENMDGLIKELNTELVP